MKYKLSFLILLCFININVQGQNSFISKFDCVYTASLSKGTIMYQNIKGAIEFSNDTIFMHFEKIKIKDAANLPFDELSGKWNVYPKSEMKLLLNKRLELDDKHGKIFRLQTAKYAEILKKFNEWKKIYDVPKKK